MQRIKSINEQRGAKLKELEALRTGAKDRAFTSDEATRFDGLATEIENLNAEHEREIRGAALSSAQPVALTRAEEKTIERFDFSKLLNHMHRSARGAHSAALDGVEAEMMQEGEREARASGIQPTGIILPRALVRRGGSERRDVTATGTTSVTGDQGGMTIATGKAGLLDDFFNGSVMRLAGATVLEGLTGNLDIPRLVAGTAAAKKTENASADEVTPTMAMLSLTPKRLPAFIDISEQLLRQSSSAIEAIFRTHITNQMLATQEAAFFHGGGTSEANGIAGTSGIGSVAGGTNGLAPTFAHMVALETAVDTSNALLGNLHYVSNGQVRGKLKQTLRNPSGTDASFILGDSGLINGYSPFFTNAVSRTLTKGSSSVASAIFFCNFVDYYTAYWSGLQLEMVRDKTNAISGLYTLVASSYYDGGVVRPKSFAAMLDALGA